MKNLTLKLVLLGAVLALGACKSNTETPAAGEGTGEAAAAATEGTGAEAAEGTGAEAAAAEGTGAAAAAAAPAADGAVTAASLNGTWNANFQKTLENQEMTEEERNMAMAFIAMMQMSMTFAEGGAMTMNATMMGQTESQTGTFEVLSVEGNTITIRATKAAAEGSGAPEIETMVVAFENNNSITMRQGTEADGETLYFDRAM